MNIQTLSFLFATDVVHKFVRDKYSKRFPELESLVHTSLEYIRTVQVNHIKARMFTGTLTIFISRAHAKRTLGWFLRLLFSLYSDLSPLLVSQFFDICQ